MRIFVSDFDGTITVKDVAQMILEKYAGPQWLEIEKEYKAKRIGTRQAIREQFELVSATEEELLRFVDDEARLDPSFNKFLDHIESKDERLEIVSEGLDFYITHLLKKWGLDIPFRTNRTTFNGDKMKIEYPHGDPRCNICGTCKMGRVIELRGQGYEVVYLGNGSSDICPALEADRVFAKDVLETLCIEEERDYIPFEDYGDVLTEVSTWR